VHADVIALSGLFWPQQKMSPELRRAHVWSRPAATATTPSKFCVQLLQVVEVVHKVEQEVAAQTFSGTFLVQAAEYWYDWP
jgi:hypothetical protein